MAFRTVHKDRNRGEYVTQGKLATGKDRTRRHAELSVAAFALEDAASFI